MNLETRVRKNPSVVARELAEKEGGVLLHLESGAYHGMNPVGLLIWQLLDGERTVASITEEVRARVRNPPASLEDDVVGFLQSALERDLIVAAD